MENTCRLCLLQSPEIVEELWEGCDILDKLSVSLSHYVSLADELPKNICYACINKVHDIYKFHQTISRNEIILQKKLDNITCNNLKGNAIKKENTHENNTDYIDTLEIDKPLEEINIKTEVFHCKDKGNECTTRYKSNIDKLNNSNQIKTEVIKENLTESKNIVISIEKHEKQIEEIKFEESKRFTCLTCFKVFSNQLELLRHYQTVELEKFNKNNTTNNKNNENELVTYKVQETDDGALVYKCERCYKKYRNKTDIKRHVVSHVETRPFLCKLCGKTYQTASIIVAHGKMHTGEMYKCSYNCGYRSVHKHVVKDHEKRHRKEYKYKCEACGKGFQVKTWYEQHQNIHKGVKPFSCEICGMAFHLHKYLTTHRSNVHPQSSGRKPWICKLCSLPCDSKNSLNLHLKEKHGVITKKSILCDICGKVVRDTQQLKQHKRAVHLHIKPYVCGVCNKSFPKKFTLTVHEQTHSGKRYSCNFCDKMFSRKSSLQRHILRFHTDSKHKCYQCEKSFTSKVKLATHKKVCSVIFNPPTTIQENNIKV